MRIKDSKFSVSRKKDDGCSIADKIRAPDSILKNRKHLDMIGTDTDPATMGSA